MPSEPHLPLPGEQGSEVQRGAPTPSPGEVTISPLPKRRSRRKQIVLLVAGLLLVWLVSQKRR
jgi:hypothetical protein